VIDQTRQLSEQVTAPLAPLGDEALERAGAGR
jgi:hypothetical protein